MVRPKPNASGNNNGKEDAENSDIDSREGHDDAIEPLREAIDVIDLTDRDDDDVESLSGGGSGEAAEPPGEEEEEDDDEKESSSFAAPTGEEGAKCQRPTGVHHVEHLHRFSFPAAISEAPPIVNVLPGPVLPAPIPVPQSLEMNAMAPPLVNGAKSSATTNASNGNGVLGSILSTHASGSKFALNRNADVKMKKSRNNNVNNSSVVDNNASYPAANSSSSRSSLWGSRVTQQANILAQMQSGSGTSGGGSGGSGASNHPIHDPDSPRPRNSSSLLPSNNELSNHLARQHTLPQNLQCEQQQHQQSQQQPQPLQHQPSNFPIQPPNPQQLQQPFMQQQQQHHQQPPQQNQMLNQQQPPPQQNPQPPPQQPQQPQQQQLQQQQPAQRQEYEGERPNPFDLNNEMELGIGHFLKDRMASLCANDILADVQFIVGTPEGAVAAGALAPPMGGVRTIPAHKCILVTASSVFYAMFCGGLASRSKDGDEIRVPDVDPEAFMAMLRYIYCEEINLEPESVLPTLYAAKKYMVNPLANECINYLEKNLKAENVCVILMQSKLYDEEELAEKCLREIDMHTEEVLNSEGFLEVDHVTLQSLVVRDGLSIPEIRLFQAVVRWAAAECLRRGLEPTPEQKRQMLGPVLHSIRIPTISLIDFSNYVSKSDLLTPEECVKMFQYFTADDKPGNLDFICEPRRKVGTERRCRRFPYFLHVSSTFYGLHSIAFKASRKVAIVGFGLYGWAQGCACHVVTAQLMYQGNVIAETHQRITAHCPEDEPTYRVKFDNPVEINADVLYSACVILNGAQSYYGMDGKERCEADGVTFVFLNSMDGSNGTNVEHGQIPEIIFTEPH